MPPNTIKVDRSTRWGNPFHVGRDGPQAECVARFARLLAGECASQAEEAWRAGALAHRDQLKGKNLALVRLKRALPRRRAAALRVRLPHARPAWPAHVPRQHAPERRAHGDGVVRGPWS
jgi:hypothetical protein